MSGFYADLSGTETGHSNRDRFGFDVEFQISLRTVNPVTHKKL